MIIPDLPEMHGELERLYGEETDKKRTKQTSHCFEVDACRPRLIKWCEGCGLDLGCGREKIRPEAVGVDLYPSQASQVVRNICDLNVFADNSFNYVFSSHALEDIEDSLNTLKEWLRVIKKEGYLVLYCPDPQYYYNIGHPKANTAHKHDYYWWDVAKIINDIHPFSILKHYGRYGPVYECGEWSWELVVQK